MIQKLQFSAVLLLIVACIFPTSAFSAEFTQDRSVRLNLSAPSYVDEIRIASGTSLVGAQIFAYTGGPITHGICVRGRQHAHRVLIL